MAGWIGLAAGLPRAALSTFFTWLIETPAAFIAVAISRSDKPRFFIRCICRIAACCSRTVTNPPVSSRRQPNGALPVERFRRCGGTALIGAGAAYLPQQQAAHDFLISSQVSKGFEQPSLAERDKLNADIQEILDMQTESWGVEVANVEINQVDLDHSMIRAIARQAEAERLRRAKVINAEGEQRAAQKLVEAAEILASERSSTIVFPFPLDFAKALPAMGGDKPASAT